MRSSYNVDELIQERQTDGYRSPSTHAPFLHNPYLTHASSEEP